MRTSDDELPMNRRRILDTSAMNLSWPTEDIRRAEEVVIRLVGAVLCE
jgi:hypothetical protein